MDTINQLISLMQIFFGLGIVARIIMLCIRLQHDGEEEAVYKKRIKHSIIMLVIVTAISGIKALIEYYYGVIN